MDRVAASLAPTTIGSGWWPTTPRPRDALPEVPGTIRVTPGAEIMTSDVGRSSMASPTYETRAVTLAAKYLREVEDKPAASGESVIPTTLLSPFRFSNNFYLAELP